MIKSVITHICPPRKVIQSPCIVQDEKGNLYLYARDGSVYHLNDVQGCSEVGSKHIPTKKSFAEEFFFFEGTVELSNK